VSRVAAATILILALVSCGAESPPNVLVIVMDTTRGDRCSVNGYERPTTPELERFARDAVVFRDAWSPSGWTGPSHASLFTGLEPLNHGFIEGNRPFLDDSAVTVAERLRDAGWTTACFSNNWVVSPEWGLAQGCDLYEPVYKQERTGTPARQTHEQALSWVIAAHGSDQPFYLFINHIEPHLPFEPNDEIAARFTRDDPSAAELAEGRAFNHPNGVGYTFGQIDLDDRQLRLLSDLYDAEIAALDHELGDLLRRMTELGLLDDTVVVITADHGEHLGENGILDHKFSLHRTLLHVPLIIRYPGRFDGGRVVDETVRLEDVAPTILELTGVPVDEPLDGLSLGAVTADRPARAVWGVWGRFEEEIRRWFPEADLAPLFVSGRSIYDGQHHLIRWSDGRELLFDVAADPLEARDRSADRPDDVEALRAQLPR